MFVEEQVVIAKVRTAHVPMEIFRFQVKREHVSEDGVHRRCNVLGSGPCQIGRRFQWSIAPVLKF
jgi:hypothetical protein